MVRTIAPQHVEGLDLLAHEPVHPVEALLELRVGPELPCHGASSLAVRKTAAGDDARVSGCGSRVSPGRWQVRVRCAMSARMSDAASGLVDVPRLAAWLGDRLPGAG